MHTKKTTDDAASGARLEQPPAMEPPGSDSPWRRCRILGSTVTFLKVDEIVSRMAQWVNEPDGRCRQIIVTGFHGLWEAHKSAELRRILNGADLWVPDGIAPVWVGRLRGLRNLRRTPGAEIMAGFFGCSAGGPTYSSFFYGDTEQTLSALRKNLQARFPNHRIAGMIAPPFRPLTPAEEQEHIETINAARPDVLWVGLGAPKQDLWIHARRDRLRVPVAVGVGAAFGFHAGLVRRCPAWLGSAGLEWLWRLYCEPKKLWRRDLLDGPPFVYHVVRELLTVPLSSSAKVDV